MSHRCLLACIFARLMPRNVYPFWLMFPRKSLPEGGTYCREIQFQQSKGPGMYSGQDQTWGFSPSVAELLCLAGVWGGGPACQPPCFQGRTWEFPQLTPGMLLALTYLAQQSCLSQGFPLQELNHFEFAVQVVFLSGAQSLWRRKIG